MKHAVLVIIIGFSMLPLSSLSQVQSPQEPASLLSPRFNSFEKQLILENQRLKAASNEWWEELVTPAFLGMLVAAVGVLATSRFNKQQIESRKWELIQSSFSWLSGGTQDRNIGIAVAEHFWDKKSQYRDTWLRLYANQAVYLLADQFDRKAQDHKRKPEDVLQRLDEELSLQRLMRRLVEQKERIEKLQRSYLVYAIEKRLIDCEKGKYVLPADKHRITERLLLEWKDEFESN